ncbi:hypothetical protein DEU56DRAFT_910893 [Suillus clintonianus]|uniref:uncharacterized protein n=1 Tax=Suillus clintonianus TaxID=1904413 RepID=UPI001B877FE6|nr:uncharacterized protein DEU56DRAFT_910893 [Suillus clintonianus]KAG2142950.1 hypothetical protein DEU56DRAFT_910893 [Suillus clintonianus]
MGDYIPDSIGLQTVAYVEGRVYIRLLICPEELNIWDSRIRGSLGKEEKNSMQPIPISPQLFDFCITFDSEVRWTWGRKWGFVRIAFVISRYLPVASFAMSVYCAIESTRGGILNHGRFSAAYILWVLLLLKVRINFKSSFLFPDTSLGSPTRDEDIRVLGGQQEVLDRHIGFQHGYECSYANHFDVGHSVRGVFEEGRHASIIYGLLAFYELVLVSVTLYKRSRFSRFESSPMVATLYRDGVIYLLCITVAAMANCVAIAVLPSTYTALLIGPQVVIHSVLASRILFNLRALQEPQDDITNITSDAVFVPTQHSVDYLELRGITNV